MHLPHASLQWQLKDLMVSADYIDIHNTVRLRDIFSSTVGKYIHIHIRVLLARDICKYLCIVSRYNVCAAHA